MSSGFEAETSPQGMGGYEELPPYDPYAEWAAPTAYSTPEPLAPPAPAAVPPPALVAAPTTVRAPFTPEELALLPKVVHGRATFGQRAKALSIDGVLCLIPAAVILAFVLPHYLHQMSADPQMKDASGALVTSATGRMMHWATVLTAAVLAVYWVILAAYTGYFMSQTNGRTPGREAAGIRVVRSDGEPITALWAIYRVVVVREIVFSFAAFFTLGLATLAQYGWSFWDSEGRTLHDLITRSREVSEAATLSP